ncbi:MAG: hypothetical protein DIZ78_16570 [endosymbiont of Escarpia spicata]|uniref:Uncharacterized protein n=1 Tax=endosymbiont of Escarpia spicata TaxID=2200908 RepID=A0A370DCE5_9GAMM|nr:MAG: hypothetical protein DIZ78_16570 [endosymbiont of Escarpia spicata]
MKLDIWCNIMKFLNKRDKSFLPIYEVRELSMKEALLMLAGKREVDRPTLIQRAAERLTGVSRVSTTVTL